MNMNNGCCAKIVPKDDHEVDDPASERKSMTRMDNPQQYNYQDFDTPLNEKILDELINDEDDQPDQYSPSVMDFRSSITN